MATRKQRAANRANAQKSTGPISPEGKAAVRLNALKHGLAAESAVIFEEDMDAFHVLLDAFLGQLHPDGPLETALVEQIVTAQWRLARCRGIETGLFELRLVDYEEDLDGKEYGNLKCHHKLAHVFHKNTDTLSTLSRYEARIERSFFRALHELQRLQAAREQPDPPPPPAKTVSAEQTQIAPKPAPKPITPNDFAVSPSPHLSVSPSAPPKSPGGILLE
jgi:hypothetical protein